MQQVRPIGFLNALPRGHERELTTFVLTVNGESLFQDDEKAARFHPISFLTISPVMAKQ